MLNYNNEFRRHYNALCGQQLRFQSNWSKRIFFFLVYHYGKQEAAFFLTMSLDERTYLKQIALTSFITTQVRNVKNFPMSDTWLMQTLRCAEILNTKNMPSKKLAHKTRPVCDLEKTTSRSPKSVLVTSITRNANE